MRRKHPEKEKISSIIDNNQKEVENFNNTIKELTNKISERNKELKEKEENERQFYTKFKKLFNERGNINSEIQKNGFS